MMTKTKTKAEAAQPQPNRGIMQFQVTDKEDIMNIMSIDFKWLFDYLDECERREEEPVSISKEYVDQCWENQQLIDKLEERTTPSFASRADFYRDMLNRRIKEHIAIWKAEEAEPQPQPQP